MNPVSIEQIETQPAVQTAPQPAVTKTARAAFIHRIYMTQKRATRVIYNLLTTPRLTQ